MQFLPCVVLVIAGTALCALWSGGTRITSSGDVGGSVL